MASGAGYSGGGIGPAGFNPAAAPDPSKVGRPPRAVNYDPSIRDFTTTNGYYDAIHPVDQAVALALTIEQGSLKSAPTVGQTYRKIPRLSGASFVKQVEDRTNLALKRLLDAQQIRIVAVNVEQNTIGQTKIEVVYVNLLTQQVVKHVNDAAIQ
jgi:hypothetical protein